MSAREPDRCENPKHNHYWKQYGRADCFAKPPPQAKKCGHAWMRIPKAIVMMDGSRFQCLWCLATTKRLPR